MHESSDAWSRFAPRCPTSTSAERTAHPVELWENVFIKLVSLNVNLCPLRCMGIRDCGGHLKIETTDTKILRFYICKPIPLIIPVHLGLGDGHRIPSLELAETFYKSFASAFPEKRMRRDWSDGDSDWESNFYILTKTRCPAVLLENFFYDNRSECAWLLLEGTKVRIADAIVAGLKKFLKK